MIANMTEKASCDFIIPQTIDKIRYVPYINDMTEAKIEAVRELIAIRDGKKVLRQWNKDEVAELTNFLTTG